MVATSRGNLEHDVGMCHMMATSGGDVCSQPLLTMSLAATINCDDSSDRDDDDGDDDDDDDVRQLTAVKGSKLNSLSPLEVHRGRATWSGTYFDTP